MIDQLHYGVTLLGSAVVRWTDESEDRLAQEVFLYREVDGCGVSGVLYLIGVRDYQHDVCLPPQGPIAVFGPASSWQAFRLASRWTRNYEEALDLMAAASEDR